MTLKNVTLNTFFPDRIFPHQPRRRTVSVPGNLHKLTFFKFLPVKRVYEDTMSSRKYYYRRPKEDPLETDMPDRSPTYPTKDLSETVAFLIVNSSEPDICLIRDLIQYSNLNTKQKVCIKIN